MGELGNTYSGLSGKRKDDFGHGSASYVNYLNIYNNPLADLNGIEKVEIDSSQNEVKYGDVFFTTSSETPEEVGLTSVWLGTTRNVYLNSFCFGYRPLLDLNPYFIANLLRSSYFRKDMRVLAQGISRYNISKVKVMELSIKIPSIMEQGSIGKLLKELDGVITLHQRRKERLYLLHQLLREHLLVKNNSKLPSLRNKNFHGVWSLSKLSEIAPLRGGFAFKSGEFQQEGIPIIRISNILSSGEVGGDFVFSSKLHNDNSFILENNAIVIAMSGATTGKTAILSSKNDKSYYQNQRVGYFTKQQNFNYEFIKILVNSYAFKEQLKRLLVSGAQPNISAKDINSFEFCIPDDDNERIFLSDLSNAITKSLSETQQKINSLISIKKLFLNKLFI